MQSIRFSFVLIFFLGAAVLHGESPLELYNRFRPVMCRVQFYKNVSSQSQIGSYIKIKQHRVGIVVNPEGLIMVNSDVYPLSLDILSGNGMSFASGEPTDFKVILHDGREYGASFVGKDDAAQAAFLQIDAPLSRPLPAVTFDESITVGIGETIYILEMLGEAYEFEPLFSEHTVNAVVNHARRRLLVKDGETALSAGGLVISARSGTAIGMTLRGNRQFNFNAPPDFDHGGREFLEIAPAVSFGALIKSPPRLQQQDQHGNAWLGIAMQALTPGLRDFWQVPASGGVIVNRVYPQSPAARAGLKVRDVIVQFGADSIGIERDEQLGRFRELISTRAPGSTIEVVYYRAGERKRGTVMLDSAPRSIDRAEKYQLSQLGVEVRQLTLDVLYEHDLPLDTKGVYVFQVDRASPAGLGGLQSGGIITRVNDQPIVDLAGFEAAMNKILSGDRRKIMLHVQWRRETSFVFVDVK